MATTAPRVSVRDLVVAYERDIEVLRGVNLDAEPGTITAVIGPNGAGKSTLLRALAGLAPVVAGDVELDGQNVTRLGVRGLLERRAVFVPQERSIFDDMTVEENLVMGGWPRRRDRRWIRERIQAVCETFPLLGDRLAERAGNLSGGQQKILEVARGLVMDPCLLMVDEPTAGLSPQMAAQVYEQLDGLRSFEVTILLVDQNVREALVLASHVYVLVLGRNDTDGTSADVLERLDEIAKGWLQHTEQRFGRG